MHMGVYATDLLCEFEVVPPIYCFTAVYLSLSDQIIPNHDYIVISDIGSTDNTALICHTNSPANYTHFGGTIHPLYVMLRSSLQKCWGKTLKI